MSLSLTTEHLLGMRSHAEAAYPHECCGILLGRYTPVKTVRSLKSLDNEREDSRHNRYLITPETMFRAELEARAEGLEIVGFYHSHPDHPARPSEFDREHAWPTYSYVIVSVLQGRAADVNSWVLSGERSHFDPELLVTAVEV